MKRGQRATPTQQVVQRGQKRLQKRLRTPAYKQTGEHPGTMGEQSVGVKQPSQPKDTKTGGKPAGSIY